LSLIPLLKLFKVLKVILLENKCNPLDYLHAEKLNLETNVTVMLSKLFKVEILYCLKTNAIPLTNSMLKK